MQLMQLLLETGADANRSDNGGFTCGFCYFHSLSLSLSASYNHPEPFAEQV
jgi:hypothetical protein